MATMTLLSGEEVETIGVDVCPYCGSNPNPELLNIGPSNYQVCHNCECFWFVGCNLYSTWRHETEEIWENNRQLLAVYERIEPAIIWIPATTRCSTDDDLPF